MKSLRSVVPMITLLAAASLIFISPARAQGWTTTSLAATGLRIIPEHHHLFWIFDGQIWAALYLNTTGNFFPEKVTPPVFIDPPNGWGAPTTGVQSGTVSYRPLLGGGFAYRFQISAQGVSTRCWDAIPAPGAETAQGYSTMLLDVSYNLSKSLDLIDQGFPMLVSQIRSVLGPWVHRSDLNNRGIGISDFKVKLQINGTGPSLSHPGQTAQWAIWNIAVTNGRGANIGQIDLRPR